VNTHALDRPVTFLRFALLADAGISGATGLMMMFGADLGPALLGLPAELLRYAGLSLLPFATLVAFVALRERISRAAIIAIIVYNALWTVDSLLLLVSGWVTPTALGYAFAIAQALAVAAFAALQIMGLRKARAA
jgi:hypothetical protein